MRAAPHNSSTRFWFVFGLALAAFFAYQILSRKYVFVVPDGYCGLVDIVQDEKGARLWPSLRGVVINIPESGVCRVKSLSLLRRLSISYAYERSGGTLQVSPLFSKGGGRRFWELYATPNHIYYYVGTRMDAGQFVKEHSKSMLGI